MTHDEIDDWYYDDADEDDIRVFDPNAVYRDFVDNIDDFDDEHIPDEEEDEDDLDGFDDDEDEMELESVEDARFYDEE